MSEIIGAAAVFVLALILLVCVAGFVVLVMIHAKIDAYHRHHGEAS